MKNDKLITIDLRTATMLGPASLIFWSLQYYYDEGFRVKLINKHWGNKKNKSGLRYDNQQKKFNQGASIYLWDPEIHPNDLLYNLIQPSFSNLEIIEKNYSFLSRVLLNIPSFFNKNLIYLNDFATVFLEEKDKKNFLRLKIDYYKENKSFIEFVRIFLNVTYINYFQKYKEKPKSKPFRFDLNKNLKTDALMKIIEDKKKSNKKYILISVLWDEGQKFEKQNDRLRGGPHFIEQDWESLLNYVKELDDHALINNNIKFVLASKKAVDWEKYLRSDYLDLRNFEELGFSLSQSIYLAQEICDATINWPSTYSIWITNCKDIIHLTWGGNKDTAKWARNNLHKESPKKLLEYLGI